MSDRQREEAKLAAAIAALDPALAAASAAAHELEAADADEAWCDRIMQLGFLADGATHLCGPKLKVLCEVMELLLDLEEPGEVSVIESRPAVQ
jgi:hypothetical protein